MLLVFQTTEGDVSTRFMRSNRCNRMYTIYTVTCVKHKMCNAMGAIQNKAVAKFVNMAGHDMAGRTYEAIGPKLIEVVSWQFSNDISVQNPHGHAQAYLDWAE